MSKGRLNSGNYKKFPKEWVSEGWHSLLGEGRDEGSVSGRENRTDKVEEHIKAWFVKVMETGKLRESNRKFLKSSLGRGKGRVIAPVLVIS